MTQRAKPSAYERAVSLLARRPHFRVELERKLRQRDYSEEEIAAALSRLREQGYLDDEWLAREFAAQRAERSGEGAARVRAEMQKRRLGEETIRGALADTMPEDDLPAARDAAGRWSRSHRPDSAALGRHLQRKGFSTRAIVRVLQDLGETDPSSPSPAPEEMEE
jgi:regulatory protein